MKANRLLSAGLLFVAFCSVASAQQRLDITLKDKSIVSCTLDDINYMEIVEGANPGELDGVWYLGWKVTSSGTTNSNGEEMLVFYAGKMKWVKKTTENIYTLTYPEGGAKVGSSFKGLREGSTTALTYMIFAMEGDMLVLKQGSSRYYFYKSKEAAITAMKPENGNYLTRAQYATGEAVWNAGIKGGNTHSSSTPMGSHYAKYAAATQEQIDWLANPSNQPDYTLADANESYNRWTAKTITLYPMTASPTPADVNQHAIGDCCMCAVFASFAYNYPQWIKTLIEKDGNNYTVHMFDPKGNPIDVVVDNKLLCNSNGDCAQVSGKNGKFDWATIMEKALMKWLTCFKTGGLGGIGTEHAAPPFTGNGDSYSFDWGDKLYNSEYPLLVDYALGTLGMIGVGGFHESDVLMGELKTVTGHAFTVMYADEGSDYAFVMRNPWGNEPNGSTTNNRTDGKLKIPFDHEKLRLIDFRFVYPGEQMAEYKVDNSSGYTPPRFCPTYRDMNPSEEMLRMYNVKDYEQFPVPNGAKLDDFVEDNVEE